ncbi:MAG: cytochrome c3 family protein [Bacteroidota bacterium]
MKLKKLVLLSTLMVGLVPLSRGQITGTHHDFRSGVEKAYNQGGEVCLVCHAPHNNDVSQTPLWNHATTQANFTAYGQGGSGYAIKFTPGQPTGASKLCLSCHDGVTAVNAYGTGGGASGLQDTLTPGTPRTLLMGALSSRSNLTTSLMTSHPVSFVYDGTLVAADPGLRDTSSSSGLGHSIGTDMLDKTGQVQCTSCHEVHGTPYYKFQRMSNVGSALCLTCHKK